MTGYLEITGSQELYTEVIRVTSKGNAAATRFTSKNRDIDFTCTERRRKFSTQASYLKEIYRVEASSLVSIGHHAFVHFISVLVSSTIGTSTYHLVLLVHSLNTQFNFHSRKAIRQTDCRYFAALTILRKLLSEKQLPFTRDGPTLDYYRTSGFRMCFFHQAHVLG